MITLLAFIAIGVGVSTVFGSAGGRAPVGPQTDALLLETGEYLLLEDGSYLLLE